MKFFHYHYELLLKACPRCQFYLLLSNIFYNRCGQAIRFDLPAARNIADNIFITNKARDKSVLPCTV